MTTQHNSLAELHDALLSWVQIRCQQPAGNAALRLYMHLRGASVLWNNISTRFQIVLTERMESVARATDEQERSTDSPAREHKSFRAWLGWAKQLRESWRRENVPDWQELLVALTEDGNELVSACVSASLRDSALITSVPSSLHRLIEELAQADLAEFDGLPLPPNVDPVEGVETKESLPTVASDESTHRGPPRLRGILPLIGKLNQQDDPQARQLAVTLEELLDVDWPVGENVESACSQRLLHILVDLDGFIAKPGRTATWTTDLRAGLRDILLADKDYVLLENQLLRRSMQSSSDLAEAVEYMSVANARSHQIVRIVRPGYALRKRDGSLEVLLQAKVVLAN